MDIFYIQLNLLLGWNIQGLDKQWRKVWGMTPFSCFDALKFYQNLQSFQNHVPAQISL